MSVPDIAYRAAALLPMLWLGFVLSISFMEAPIKFRAPGVSRNVALSIGRVVFRALARVELVLWLLVALALWVAGWPPRTAVWFAALTALLIAQQVWLLPTLDRRAATVIADQPVAANPGLHRTYVATECAKVACLPALAWSVARLLSVSGV